MTTTTFDLTDLATRLGTPISEAPEIPEVLQDQGTEPTPTRTHRPTSIEEMLGQDAIRVQVALKVKAAIARDKTVPHCLFQGPPGLGKTTLAAIIAHETGGKLVTTTASAVNTVLKMAKALAELDDGDVLFIDEVHGLARLAMELLYTAMEDYRIEVSAGTGKRVQTRSIDLNKFILAAATTEPGKLAPAFRGRFGYIASLQFYTDAALATIIERAAEKGGLTMGEGAALALAKRSRGTPRAAVLLLEAAADYAVVGTDSPVITEDAVLDSLALHGIDSLGLTADDRVYLHNLCVDHMGGPVGLVNPANCTGLDSPTIQTAIEPFLLRCGLIRRSANGRMATKAAYAHLGLRAPVTLAWQD
jgi:holliday junction DNA helicase RuvB